MNQNFLGYPPLYVRHWLRDRKLPAGAFTEVVKALEKGDIKNGCLNGIRLDGKAIAIGNEIVTDCAYYQGKDGTLVAEYPFAICGFNGAVPEYVKYLTDDERYFVKATDDNDAERAFADGDPVYTRTWDANALDYTYGKAGTIAKQEGKFEYGATNADYGTVSIKDPYAVPAKLTVALDSGKVVEAEFAGHNMQLYSSWLLFDADFASSYAEAKAAISDTKHWTTYPMQDQNYVSDNRWSVSPNRNVCNGLGIVKCLQTQWSESGHSAGINVKPLRTKMSANTDALLPNVCKQVNRNWTYGGTVECTVDWFWLAGADMLADSQIGYWATWSGREDYFPDRTIGLCKEAEFSSQKGAKRFINGVQGHWNRSYEVFRSANKVWDSKGAGKYSNDNIQSNLFWNAQWCRWPTKDQGGLAMHPFGNPSYYSIAPCCSIG